LAKDISESPIFLQPLITIFFSFVCISKHWELSIKRKQISKKERPRLREETQMRRERRKELLEL
jgi:hypothetical protein